MKKLTFRVWGRYGLFSDPLTRIGGEKSTLLLPTYSALKGVCESIYWKPSLLVYVDRVKILNPIRTESKGIRPIKYHQAGNTLSYYTYLSRPNYLVEFHYEFNDQRPDLKNDWNKKKHLAIFERSLKKGGRRDIYLGTRECQAYVEPADFDDFDGYYEQNMDFGLTYHSITYPDENQEQILKVNFWHPRMVNSVIEFCKPEECEVHRDLRQFDPKYFESNKNMKPVGQEYEDEVGL